MLRNVLTFLSVVVMALPVGAEYTTGAERLESEHELSMDYETPHTKWAKPYAQGTTRVLYVAPYYQGSTEGRELIELMQRFDLEADMVYFQRGPNRLLGDNNTRWYVTDAVGTERVLRLLETPYDVIFLNQVTLTELNDVVRDALKAAVQKGTGLVYVGEEAEWGRDSFKRAQAPPSGIGITGAYTHGSGRVIQLPLREKLTFSYGWELALDHQLAIQGRALLWAANRAPKSALDISISETGKHKASWSGVSAGSTLEVSLRDAMGTDAQLLDVGVADSGSTTFEIPELTPGRYHLNAFLRKDDAIENWLGNGTINTESLGEIVLERGWAELGERIEGHVVLAGERVIPEPLERQGSDAYTVRLFDTSNRMLAEQRISEIQDGQFPFSFEVADWFPMLVRVEAVAEPGARHSGLSNAYVRITKRKQDQFNLIMWNVPSGDLAPYGIERMAQLGVTTILQGGPPDIALSASDLTYVPYVTSFRASSHTVTAMLNDEGILKTGCVHDEATMTKYVAEVVARAQEAREHGTFVYSLGDENAVRASCLGPHCLTAYRGYLKDIYGDINALNVSWGSDYGSFDDITLMTDTPLPAEDAPRWFKEYFAQRTLKNQTDSETSGEEQIRMGDINDEIRALQEENYARWYDRQAFQSWTYVQWCKRFIKAFREIDPHSLTGFEGTDSFSIRRLTTRSRQGGDLDLFMREMEYFGPYRGPANEVTRSLAKPGFPAGNWIGYSRDPDVLLMNYWKQVLDNMCAVQWWRWDNMGEEYQPFLAPTLSPIGAGKEFMEETRVIREGLGDLLMHYTMETNNIAMLYSMPSTHIAHFDGNRSYGKLKRDHDRWHEAIQNAGLQFDYVTDRMLRLGEFDGSKYKVLILTEAFALGEKEAAVIRDFVAQGGTVIGDVRPGLYSDRCKPYEAGILDALFGVTRTGKQDAMAIDRMRIQGVLNDTDVYMEWGNWYGKEIYPEMHVDPTVELTTGEALGWSFPIHYHGGLKHPAGIVNSHGKGKAILLNFSVYQAPFDALLRDLLAASGARPTIQVSDSKSLPAEGPKFAGINDSEVEDETPDKSHVDSNIYPPGVEVTLWRDGDTELLALLSEHTGNVTVTLPEARFVYDLISETALGQTTTFEVALKKSRARIYALLPVAGDAPTVTLASAKGKPGDKVVVTIAAPETTSHRVINVRLLNPDGNASPWFDHKVVYNGGAIGISIPFALNDKSGAWTVEAEDILTGLVASTPIELQ